MIYGDTEKSYRKTTQLINRIRHQEEEGTPSRTLHESTEREGADLLDHIEEKSKCILEENGFSKDGMEYANDQPVIMAENEVAVAIETCREYCGFPDDILNNPVAYEDPEESINIAIDDVIVKKQEEIRKGGRKTERGKRKYVHNTVVHVAQSGVSYILNGHSIKNVLLFLTAFIFHNGLIKNRF
ncbi:MAG: hypothetical protein JRI62_08705, partial [Deltaproteobacteria bacterium]|nr:hypothetical protein [Deltaproteobacteria bacterium]